MMSKEPEMSGTLPPPFIPLQILSKPAPQPVPLPPGSPILEPAVPKKKERRLELQGLDPGDPRSTVHLLRKSLGNVARTVPPLLRRYAWVLPVILVVWSILGSFDAYRLMFSMPALTPLWMFLDKIILILVFLTASYNNFIGKAVYGTLVIRVVLPLVRRGRREGLGKVSGEFKSLIPNMKTNWQTAGAGSLGLFITFGGCAAFLSNFLTRNNAVDKIAVSLVIGLSLIKALSDGPRSIPFMTGRVVMKDIFVAFRKPSPVRNHHIFVAISGLALGFFSSLLLAVLRKSLGENIGYILGAIAVVSGIVLFLALKSKKADA
jgi:hypothetical protein